MRKSTNDNKLTGSVGPFKEKHNGSFGRKDTIEKKDSIDKKDSPGRRETMEKLRSSFGELGLEVDP